MADWMKNVWMDWMIWAKKGMAGWMLEWMEWMMIGWMSCDEDDVEENRKQEEVVLQKQIAAVGDDE